jgi:hypothetical protein
MREGCPFRYRRFSRARHRGEARKRHCGGCVVKKGDFIVTAVWLIVCAGFLLYGLGLALLG